MNWEQLTQALKVKAYQLGFNMVGVVEARPSPRLGAYKAWLAQAYHGEMGYLGRPDRIVRREDLGVILPGVERLVCVGLDYKTRTLPVEIATDASRGRISNYAWGVDYHDVMTPRLEALGAWLAAEVGEGEVANKVYVDTGAILERDHGHLAGLGFVGKNTMLIGPRRGSWFFLGELLTTAPLVVDEIGKMPSCGQCQRCLVACPTDAFPEPYVLDARRCISYLTIELKGWIPRDLRPLIGNWIYGCDICQEVCPFNRFANISEEEGFWPNSEDSYDGQAPFLLDLLWLDEVGFKERFAESPIKRIKWRRFMRNVCVAAGNWGDERVVPRLIALLNSEEPLVRGHAAWALGRVGVEAGKEAMRRALVAELDERVREEMSWALEIATN
ncbi:MAG TPA: tRNA epoxyqueuosine(34) reductase QueG [Anaerolineae bacterium]|nr:tRNA epoxyqueuosine(34) reductase QueG [Anaerolineae bacterium]